MTRLALMLILAATPAVALQCPNGEWRDLEEHCDTPPRYQCVDGTWRDAEEDCAEQRPPQRPNGD